MPGGKDKEMYSQYSTLHERYSTCGVIRGGCGNMCVYTHDPFEYLNSMWKTTQNVFTNTV